MPIDYTYIRCLSVVHLGQHPNNLTRSVRLDTLTQADVAFWGVCNEAYTIVVLQLPSNPS